MSRCLQSFQNPRCSEQERTRAYGENDTLVAILLGRESIERLDEFHLWRIRSGQVLHNGRVPTRYDENVVVADVLECYVDRAVCGDADGSAHAGGDGGRASDEVRGECEVGVEHVVECCWDGLGGSAEHFERAAEVEDVGLLVEEEGYGMGGLGWCRHCE